MICYFTTFHFILFKLLLFLHFADEFNFSNVRTCFHEENKSLCLNGSIRIINTNISYTILHNISEEAIYKGMINESMHLKVSVAYLSSDRYCYPYLSINWITHFALLKKINYFDIRIKYHHLGREIIYSRYLKILIKDAFIHENTQVNFIHDCKQIDYPGAQYTVQVKGHTFEGPDVYQEIFYNSPCHFNHWLHPDKTKEFGDSKNEETWRPKHNISLTGNKIIVCFTMPDCNMPFPKFKIVVKSGNLSLTSKEFYCECGFNRCYNFNINITNGSYTVELYVYVNPLQDFKKLILQNESTKNSFKAENFSGYNSRHISTTSENIVANGRDVSKYGILYVILLIVMILLAWIITVACLCHKKFSKNNKQIDNTIKNRKSINFIKKLSCDQYDSGIGYGIAEQCQFVFQESSFDLYAEENNFKSMDQDNLYFEKLKSINDSFDKLYYS